MIILHMNVSKLHVYAYWLMVIELLLMVQLRAAIEEQLQ
jgi:hypothetical protein